MGIARAQGVGMLISYAIGALLGAAFLEVLPHALEHGDPHRLAATVLAGILVFFVLEKLVLWRHCHHEPLRSARGPGAGRRSRAQRAADHVGDTFHNFVYGVLIAAAFMESTDSASSPRWP